MWATGTFNLTTFLGGFEPSPPGALLPLRIFAPFASPAPFMTQQDRYSTVFSVRIVLCHDVWVYFLFESQRSCLDKLRNKLVSMEYLIWCFWQLQHCVGKIVFSNLQLNQHNTFPLSGFLADIHNTRNDFTTVIKGAGLTSRKRRKANL